MIHPPQQQRSRMIQRQSLLPPHPLFPPQKPPLPPQQHNKMMIQRMELHPPSLQEHPPPQFVAAKSLMLKPPKDLFTVYSILGIIKCEKIRQYTFFNICGIICNECRRQEKRRNQMKRIDFERIFDNIRRNQTMVHCITNYVTINDVANMILAIGASPIMADDWMEVREITSMCDSLVINMGTLKQNTVRSMLLAGKEANQRGHLVVFDPVGVGASRFRKETAAKLLKQIHFNVIRGNISEIKTLYEGSDDGYGVDAKKDDAVTEDNLEYVIQMAKNMAKKTKAVIVITGKTDLVTDGQQIYLIDNGVLDMSRITGTGCMLDGVIAGFIGANPDQILEAVTTAVSAMGICGEYAKEKAEGTGTLKVHLMDAMSNMNAEWMERSSQIESKC